MSEIKLEKRERIEIRRNRYSKTTILKLSNSESSQRKTGSNLVKILTYIQFGLSLVFNLFNYKRNSI